MMASAAAIEGISHNGLRWKRHIRLGQWPAYIGKMNDQKADGVDIDGGEVERAVMKIVAIIRSVCEKQEWAKETDLSIRADDLEAAADCGLTEVNYFMGELYDSFDFHRVLVQSSRL